ncbi:MAG: galactitol-1-phosphate 5-dehydrogenase [Spirochaetales bacterium]|nr:galactitol-1-phosphate 5-dehydrogenase [Spirochaetales bacterium]MCF7938332.1 galactitol-1-phosphate 5-dehydrogenase [Spirochaetales bacterium]
MKALVLKENARFEFQEVPKPVKPGEDWVLVRVRAAGICGSDIPRAFEGGAYHHPLILGHEFAGTLEEPAQLPWIFEGPVRSASGGPTSGGLAAASEGHSSTGLRLEAGSPVAVFPLINCGVCGACQTGDYAQCSNYDYLGSRRDGGFAEFVYVPRQNLFPVPEGVDLLHAAMTEPAAVALHGIRRMVCEPGDSAVVFGGGPIGNMAASWLQMDGADPVYLVDIDSAKLEQAEKKGFLPIDSRSTDPVDFLRRQTGGGAACVVVACGLPLTYRQALSAAGRGGRVVLMGNLHGSLTLEEKEMSSVLRRELRIFGTWNSGVTPRGRDDWSRVLRAMAAGAAGRGGLNVDPLISHTPELSEGPEVFRRIYNREEPFNKVIFRI